MTTLVKCCGKGHEDQVSRFPVGTRVVTITETTHLPISSIGEVTAHCDDGRAYFHFGPHGSHTFHKPEDFVVWYLPKVDNVTKAWTESQQFQNSSLEERAVFYLARILEDLPAKRDWLDPQIEKEARDLVLQANK